MLNTTSNPTHANLDSKLRFKKAEKIDALIRKRNNLKGRCMLEVGTGSGFIAQYFSANIFGNEGTVAIDVVDERQTLEGYRFQLVQDTNLPFEDGMFDFIISNHVIEHVGSKDAQINHLNEIFRCLEVGGTFYFAVPNRWGLIEPHYKLPLLSWLPNDIASIYTRTFRNTPHYDCKPLSRRQAIGLLHNSQFEFVDSTLDAIKLIGEIEGGLFKKVITKLPKAFWRPLLFIMPTLIFVCRKPSA